MRGGGQEQEPAGVGLGLGEGRSRKGGVGGIKGLDLGRPCGCSKGYGFFV